MIYRMFREKLKSNKGISRLGLLLLIIDIALVIVVAIPGVNYIKEQERKQQDYGHEQVAEDSAIMEYAADGSFEAVYDAIEKKFVDLKDIQTVEPYGNAKEHQGMVIIVKTDEDGAVSVTWVDPEEYKYK